MDCYSTFTFAKLVTEQTFQTTEVLVVDQVAQRRSVDQIVADHQPTSHGPKKLLGPPLLGSPPELLPPPPPPPQFWLMLHKNKDEGSALPWCWGFARTKKLK